MVELEPVNTWVGAEIDRVNHELAVAVAPQAAVNLDGAGPELVPHQLLFAITDEVAPLFSTFISLSPFDMNSLKVALRIPW